MKKIIFLFIMTAIIGFAFISCANAWPFYSKPAFRGRVIDAETKKPIEGTVVVVLYRKCHLIGNPGGPSAYIFKAKETLTDENGEFYISSYFDIIPFSEDRGAEFIFFKPGYKSIEKIEATKLPDEKYFGIEKDMIGKEGEIRNIDMFGNLETWKGPLGVVDLEKARTRKERLDTKPLPPNDYTSKELPLFIKSLNEERNNLGLKGGYK